MRLVPPRRPVRGPAPADAASVFRAFADALERHAVPTPPAGAPPPAAAPPRRRRTPAPAPLLPRPAGAGA
jgi:hypothetical protein